MTSGRTGPPPGKSCQFQQQCSVRHEQHQRTRTTFEWLPKSTQIKLGFLTQFQKQSQCCSKIGLKTHFSSYMNCKAAFPLSFKTQTSSGGTNMMKAYKLVTYNKVDDKSFTNNAFQAFQLLEIRRHGSSPSAGIRGIDFVKLIQMVMVEYPDEVIKVLIGLTGIKDEQTLCFSEFLAALRSALLLESYCEEMLQIFNYLDSKSVNRVKKENLIYAIGKLNTSASCKIRIPPKEDVEHMLQQFHTDSPTEINSKEFLITMLKATHHDSY